VTLGDGRARTVKEYDLACKVDSNTNGPRPDTPALVTTGGLVIAPFAVFADLDELRRSLRSACRG
jgi:hypothetical protein